MSDLMTTKDYGKMLHRMVELSLTLFPGYNDEIYRILSKLDEDAKLANHADTVGYHSADDLIELADNLLEIHRQHSTTNAVHGETSATVGLDIVKNLRVANYDEALEGTLDNHLMTPYLGLRSLEENGLKPLNEHIDDKNLPHETTAKQLDGLTRPEVDSIVNTKYFGDETVAGANFGELSGRKNYSQLLAHVRKNLPSKNFTTGIVPPTTVATGTPSASTVVNPLNRSWVDFKNHLTRIGAGSVVAIAGFSSGTSVTTSFNYIQNNPPYKDLPENSVVFFRSNYNAGWGGYIYNSNGGSWSRRNTVYAAVYVAAKVTANSWVLL